MLGFIEKIKKKNSTLLQMNRLYLFVKIVSHQHYPSIVIYRKQQVTRLTMFTTGPPVPIHPFNMLFNSPVKHPP